MQRSRPGEFTTCELTSTSPRSAVNSPAMIRISVVLPQPLGPSSDTNSFLRMAREILYSATRPGLRGSFCSKKILERRRTSSIHQTYRRLGIRNPEALIFGRLVPSVRGQRTADRKIERRELAFRGNRLFLENLP